MGGLQTRPACCSILKECLYASSTPSTLQCTSLVEMCECYGDVKCRAARHELRTREVIMLSMI